MKKVEIFVATHKEYEMPKDEMYTPIFVGSKGKESIADYVRDDSGKNISEKNPYYCELTALYWAWKNSDAEFIGLAHYRRHFKGKEGTEFRYENRRMSMILSERELKNNLKEDIVIVPKHRNYYIETLYSHYSHTHYEEHLIKTRQILEKLYPNYVVSYDKVMKQTHGYMFNMLIMSSDNLNYYCEWLFSILGELEKVVKYEKYDSFQARLFGRVSELLLNVWLEKNEINTLEIPWMSTEKVNIIRKGSSFLRAKFLNEKFDSSF